MKKHIKILLIKNIHALGKIGDTPTVRPGYARNFLYPKKIAIPIYDTRAKQIKLKQKILTDKKRKLIKNLEKIKKKISNLKITITSKASKNGILFGSIGVKNIEKALKKIGYNINQKNIKLKSPIKKIGLYNIDIILKENIKGNIKVVIVKNIKTEKN